MKPLLLCSVLLGVSVAAHAQAPVGSRALNRAEVKRARWPRFERVAGAPSMPEVMALQLLLRNQGFFKTKPDGVFGDGTVRAVKSFQRSKRLAADGVVASQTWSKLCPRLKRGDKGDGVRALQTLLNLVGDEGAVIKMDGVFGFSTEQALRFYQKDADMKADGIAGAQTWSLLLTPEEGD